MIIFDFDGTIANTFPLAVGVINKLASYFGYEKLSESDIETFRSLKLADIRSYLRLSWMEVPLFIIRVREELFKQVGFIRPVLGMEDVVSELKGKNHTLGLVTSNSSSVVEQFTGKYFPGCFSFVYAGAAIFGKDKIIREILDTYHLDSKEVVYVGDEVRDVDAARRAGIEIISVSWGFQGREMLKKINPEFLVDSPHQLREKLAKIID